MTYLERYYLTKSAQQKTAELVERMQNEQKSRAKGTQTSEENQAQSGETRSKKFDDIYEEVELCGQMRELF